VRRAAAGEVMEPSPGQERVLDRLVDAGALHPVAGEGPHRFGPDDVTIVVPVRDRPDGLDRLLPSLGRSGPEDRPSTVVVVDDGSIDADAHASVARSHGAHLVRRDRPAGPGVARHDGISVVGTPLVAVLDSDAVVTTGWLGPLLAQLDDERVVAVAARVRSRPGPSAVARYETVRSPIDLGAEPARVAPGSRVSYVPAAGLLMVRDAYEHIGGYDPSLRVGEDVDLVWRLIEHGWRVRYEPASVIEHDPRPDLRAWLRQRFDYGTSAAALDERHPGRVAPVTCSPWSAAGWVAAAAGHPVVGGAVLAGSAAALPRRLEGVPASTSLQLAVAGHLGAGRLLSKAVVRVWWPVALVLSVVSPRARRVAGAAVAAVVVQARADSGDGGLDPVSFAALTVADDVAYGAGVWSGCLRHRSSGALLPRLSGWPSRRDPASADGVGDGVV
jgi:mycofactocin glycosyltransferase